VVDVRKTVTVVLVDDTSLARDGAVARIRALSGVLVLAASAEIEVAVEKVRETAPDITLLNLAQEGEDNLTLAGALHGEAPDSRVIIMGLMPLHKDVAGLIRAGASGFIMAGASFEKCLQTINSVAEGTQVLPLELTRSLFGQLNRRIRAPQRKTLDVQHLTAREREVADLIVAGSSSEEIARRLKIALRTAKNHVHKVLSKLAVNGRLELAAFSQKRRGLAPSLPHKPARPA
jgi:DNA-binding NarL/FixJ family response regulator